MLKLIIGLTLVFVIGFAVFAQMQDSQKISTRFGVLSVNDDKLLRFKEQPLRPPIEGNNSLDLGSITSMGAADVVLVTDNGGTGCPAMFYLVTVTSAGAKASRPFGSCSEFANVRRRGNSISVTMPGFLGPFEPRAAQRRAARRRHVFIYRGGVVYENGKPVK